PSAAVTVLAIGEGAAGGGAQGDVGQGARLIVTPPSPGSPGSRTPLPLRSLNFVPEIVPVRTPAKFPKRFPTELPLAGRTTVIPPEVGTVCVKPVGGVSVSTYVPAANPVKRKLPSAAVTFVCGVPPPEGVSVIVTPDRGGSPGSRTPLALVS